MRREIKKFSSNTNLKSEPKKPAEQSTRGAKSTAATQRSNSSNRGRASAPAQKSTKTQSAGRGGRRH